MKFQPLFIAVFALGVLCNPAFSEDFTPLFNGENLDGWEGEPSLWRVEDGAIVGETSDEKPIEYNQFLIWKNGEVDDFELKAKYKIDSGNSGIQVRSFMRGNPHQLAGYQADIDSTGKFTGICYGEGFRGILSKRGETAEMNEEGKSQKTGDLGDPAELGAKVKAGEWNDYHIIAKGHKITIKINGETMTELTDNDTDTRRRVGLLGFQLHKGPAMKVHFKDIMLKRLPITDVKKVVFVAGKPSHPPRTHEHNAGCKLAAHILNKHHSDKLVATVYTNGWPEDSTAFDNCHAVVMHADGGIRHPAAKYLDVLADLRKKKIGVGAIHYAVEMLPGETNDELTRCIGGAFETNYSVNPHWVAQFTTFPDHPVAAGVEPFEINDEWYFNMRFAEGMKGVIPILSAIPPEETMARKDGAHSGNPDVRKMVAEKQPQHLLWLYERPDGGRGFGFTGTHYHDNWANDSFRTAVYNAIAWIAGVEIPAQGIVTPTPDKPLLDMNLDPKKPRKPKANKSAAKKAA
ncbi:MAG: DUF1080 domain-containing protein [Verrucomicrobiales bacterium]|nr:DUF1080 domain-containing protein [Verrucomicrobiales bacterium]